MRSAALPLVVLLFSSAASAQLTLLPQVGIDQSRTALQYNGGPSFAPLCGEVAPRAAVRLDYRLKSGLGPFLGVATSAAPVAYNFANPTTGDKDYRASNSDRRWQLEGGWQYSTKPIVFKNRKAVAAARARSTERSEVKSHCGAYAYRSHCGSSANKVSPIRNQSWNMRVQPFAGVAYVPALKEDLAAQGGTYTYRAGNWNTALLAGTGFEFGRGSDRLFTLSVQYLKGLGNLKEKTLVTESDAKTTITRLKSDVSGWSVGVGLPFSLTKKKSAPQVKSQPTEQKSRCSEYRYRCGKRVI